MALGKDKRKVAFVRAISGTYHIVGKPMRIRTSAKTVRLKLGKDSQTFELDISKPAFRSGRTWFYFVDFAKGQVDFKEPRSTVSGDCLDVFASRKTIKQLVSGIEKPEFMNYLIYIILSIGMGLPLGYILGNLYPM